MAAATACRGGVLEQAGVPAEVRKVTFFSVCVPVRLGLALAVLLAGRTAPFATAVVVALLSVLSLIYLGARETEDHKCAVWWSRKMHMISLVVLVGAAVMSMYGVISPNKMAMVMTADVVSGALSAFSWASFF